MEHALINSQQSSMMDSVLLVLPSYIPKLRVYFGDLEEHSLKWMHSQSLLSIKGRCQEVRRGGNEEDVVL